MIHFPTNKSIINHLKMNTFIISHGSKQVSGKLIRKCALGTELVDWLLNLSAVIHSRTQTAGMWQALLEEGVLSHGTNIFFYLFRFLFAMKIIYRKYRVKKNQFRLQIVKKNEFRALFFRQCRIPKRIYIYIL